MSTQAVSFVAAALVASLLATPASAGPSPKDRLEATKLVAEAKRLLGKGELKKALAKLRRADELAPQVLVKVELGKVETDLGNYVGGLDAFDAALRVKTANPQEKRAQADAKKLGDSLRGRTPRLSVEIFRPEASKVTLLLDGEDVEPGEHRMNPGKHEVVARAAGYQDFTKAVRLDEGDATSVSVSMTPLGGEEVASSSGGGVPRWAAWTTWGLSAAAVGVGAGFGIMAIQTTNQVLVDYGCENGKCPASAAGDLDIAKLNGNVSTAAFAVGGVGVVTATVLSVLAFGKSPDAESGDAAEARLEVKPLVGPGFLGMTGSF